jgi:hypothetical protein
MGAEKARERLHVQSNLFIAYITAVNKAEFLNFTNETPWSNAMYVFMNVNIPESVF